MTKNPNDSIEPEPNNKDRKNVVSENAKGSLEPLSISKMEANSPFKFKFFERNIENTEAASVEEIIEPNKKPSIQPKLKTR